jgi:hypothetical protein
MKFRKIFFVHSGNPTKRVKVTHCWQHAKLLNDKIYHFATQSQSRFENANDNNETQITMQLFKQAATYKRHSPTPCTMQISESRVLTGGIGDRQPYRHTDAWRPRWRLKDAAPPPRGASNEHLFDVALHWTQSTGGRA